jgi:hypothetical protein
MKNVLNVNLGRYLKPKDGTILDGITMFELNEIRTFTFAEGQHLVQKEGIICGRTREKEPRYDFKVGDKIYLNIKEKNIR